MMFFMFIRALFPRLPSLNLPKVITDVAREGEETDMERERERDGVMGG